MKTRHCALIAILLTSAVATGDDWQNCRTDSSYSFADLKTSLHRTIKEHLFHGWDDKIIARSGDLTSLAILRTLNDDEMTSPDNLKVLLADLHTAFACPQRCVSVIDDRQPRLTLLLLEHMRSRVRGKTQSDIDETKEFVLRQGREGE